MKFIRNSRQMLFQIQSIILIYKTKYTKVKYSIVEYSNNHLIESHSIFQSIFWRIYYKTIWYDIQSMEKVVNLLPSARFESKAILIFSESEREFILQVIQTFIWFLFQSFLPFVQLLSKLSKNICVLFSAKTLNNW